MTDDSGWENAPDNIEDYVGFVYMIINNISQRYYVGQKKFWFNRKLKPLKGKKNSRHKTVESDWKSYYGSCKELQADVKRFGKENFTRRIRYWCISKSSMNYYESKWQFELGVLLDKLSYNGIINCRISRNMLKL